MNNFLHFLITAALVVPALATAQTTTITTTSGPVVVLPSQQVSQLAPQLIAFAGGQINFDNLVNGLALGSQVTLVSALPGGQVQTVTFMPQGTMNATQIAQTLESTRQSLISRGIATPTAQQVAVALAGGALPTQTGTVQVAGLLHAANLPAATTAAAGGTAATPGGITISTTTATTPATRPAVGSPSPAAILQGQNGAGTTPPSPAQILQDQRGPNISDTPTPGNISNTPTTTAPTTATTASPATATSGPERAAPSADRTGGTSPAAGSTAPAQASPAPAAPAR